MVSPDSVRIALLPSEANSARAEVSWGEKKLVVETSANVSLDHSATPWLYPAVLVGMKRQLPVTTEHPVDSVALSGTDNAQAVLDSWFQDLHTVKVDADTAPPDVSASASASADSADGRGVGCFFSGGLDSFYSAITHGDEITHVIFVHGFDIMLDNEKLHQSTVTAMRRAAADLGKPLIEVRTNLRHLHHINGVDWGKAAHGAMLAHVGLLLSEHVHSVIIPSSYSGAEIDPWGSHPDLDPSWSSSSVQFIHDSTEVSRPEKAAGIAHSKAALDNLHVCWTNYGNTYNCGKCEKCVRTMINLHIAGALDRCPVLPNDIPITSITRTYFDRRAREFVYENLVALRASSLDDPALEEALDSALRRGKWKQAELSVRKGLRDARLVATALGTRAARKIGTLIAAR